jgi:hypothetical protein
MGEERDLTGGGVGFRACTAVATASLSRSFEDDGGGVRGGAQVSELFGPLDTLDLLEKEKRAAIR